MDGEPKKNYIIKRMRRFKKKTSAREKKNIVIEWVVQNSLIDKKK
ncbi:Uncharacterized protein APZ42_018906 [Daphnia magna]|uniref:Uncharacterized protein n=1 Tax=Daphnia magna TaxID=35525 RepID=A0A164YWZ3_9CRUS|nr:Uncharacterized protein APZ42_018906 [Daphnia magna]